MNYFDQFHRQLEKQFLQNLYFYCIENFCKNQVTRLGDFSPLRLLFGRLVKEIAQKWQYLGLQIYYIFTQISSLKIVSNLALFCLATYLATFKKLGNFFLIIWSPWQEQTWESFVKTNLDSYLHLRFALYPVTCVKILLFNTRHILRLWFI